MLSRRERQIIANKEDVNGSYKRKVKSKAFSKALKALDDLILLATEFPGDSLEKVFNPEKITKLLDALLKDELKPTEVFRLPPSMGRARPLRGRYWVRIGGVKREKNGSPIRKHVLRRRLILAHSISTVVHRNLSQLSPLGPKQIVWLKTISGEIVLSVSKCKVIGKEIRRYNFQTKEVEKTVDRFMALQLKDKDLKEISVIVIQGKDNFDEASNDKDKK